MAIKPYSDEQRRVAAASFYKMSMTIRAKRKEVKIDRDIFIILALVYIAHHAGETVNIAQLVEPVGKNWGAVKNKLVSLEKKGLVKIEDHPHDGRALSVQVQPALFDYLGAILDELIEMMCISVECIKRHGGRRHRRSEEAEAFCREIATFCRLEPAGLIEKSVK